MSDTAFWGCGVESVRRDSVLVQHAVRTHGTTAWCGASVQPVMIGNWHLPFVPTGSASCQECTERWEQAAKTSRKTAVKGP
ncbi:hypothetical protein H4W80_007440 [Nonomuraea angiospora]|jgi:hypothetical protein|uniref:DUF3039 domain-containing protein n=1 Tax=Nonomuraea angiospora TaxID=46172 RepID=A0ABR9M9J8_9ACTN|nr:hypothetical protein [Nonomuraea angiospora]